ncbi:MAG TPA: hypothetical protein DEB55_16910 [Microbacterium sp.]|nr:hypothetical protein [Microbacterium sp.]
MPVRPVWLPCFERQGIHSQVPVITPNLTVSSPCARSNRMEFPVNSLFLGRSRVRRRLRPPPRTPRANR